MLTGTSHMELMDYFYHAWEQVAQKTLNSYTCEKPEAYNLWTMYQSISLALSPLLLFCAHLPSRRVRKHKESTQWTRLHRRICMYYMRSLGFCDWEQP